MKPKETDSAATKVKPTCKETDSAAAVKVQPKETTEEIPVKVKPKATDSAAAKVKPKETDSAAAKVKPKELFQHRCTIPEFIRTLSLPLQLRHFLSVIEELDGLN